MCRVMVFRHDRKLSLFVNHLLSVTAVMSVSLFWKSFLSAELQKTDKGEGCKADMTVLLPKGGRGLQGVRIQAVRCQQTNPGWFTFQQICSSLWFDKQVMMSLSLFSVCRVCWQSSVAIISSSHARSSSCCVLRSYAPSTCTFFSWKHLSGLHHCDNLGALEISHR